MPLLREKQKVREKGYVSVPHHRPKNRLCAEDGFVVLDSCGTYMDQDDRMVSISYLHQAIDNEIGSGRLDDILERLLPKWSDESLAFCKKHNIGSYAEKAAELVRSCFPNIQSIRFELDSLMVDDGDDQETLVLEVNVATDSNQAFNSYQEFVKRWVESAPWPQRRMIRLAYYRSPE